MFRQIDIYNQAEDQAAPPLHPIVTWGKLGSVSGLKLKAERWVEKQTQAKHQDPISFSPTTKKNTKSFCWLLEIISSYLCNAYAVAQHATVVINAAVQDMFWHGPRSGFYSERE